MLFGGWAEFYSFEYGVVTILDIFLCTAKVILDLFRKFRNKSVNKRKKNQNSPVISPAELPLGCIILKHFIVQYICTQLYKWDCASLEPVFSFYFKTHLKIIFHSTECSVLYSFTRWSVRCGHKRGHREVQKNKVYHIHKSWRVTARHEGEGNAWGKRQGMGLHQTGEDSRKSKEPWASIFIGDQDGESKQKAWGDFMGVFERY